MKRLLVFLKWSALLLLVLVLSSYVIARSGLKDLDQKARGELGWEAETGFQSGIRGTVDWYVENRAWWEAIRAGTYGGQRLGLVGPCRDRIAALTPKPIAIAATNAIDRPNNLARNTSVRVTGCASTYANMPRSRSPDNDNAPIVIPINGTTSSVRLTRLAAVLPKPANPA